jgi:predicted AlkP superfamily pyrophosphatase or phosphodiesterase
MRRWIVHVAVSICAALAACVSAPAPTTAPPPAPLILIGIDGFRADYIERGVTPTLSAIAQRGVRAEAMRPSFPSVTFPNHLTLVTGKRPDHHGIVGNVMEDPERPGAVFTLRDRAEATDPFWWRETFPIWVSAERAGLRTAAMFWPGTEVEIDGVRPSAWSPFNQAKPSSERVDQVLAWLDAPLAKRPRFMTLYFDIVDTAGHIYGPDAPQINAAIADVDAALARLETGLSDRGLAGAVNLVIVSDHGMAALAPERTIDLDALAPPASARLAWAGRAYAGVAPAAGQEAAVASALVRRHDHMECWRKEAMPARFEFGAHRRIPPIFCLADVGWSIVSSAAPETMRAAGGAHGYDPDDPSMASLFVAAGPAFRAGATVPAFDNVHVYPLLARVMGIAGEPGDGDGAALAGALAQ